MEHARNKEAANKAKVALALLGQDVDFSSWSFGQAFATIVLRRNCVTGWQAHSDLESEEESEMELIVELYVRVPT